MTNTHHIVSIGKSVVRKHRKSKLEAGKSFMINSSDLPEKQSYLEFPDQTIKLVSVTSDSKDFSVIKELSIKEATLLRERFGINP